MYKRILSNRFFQSLLVLTVSFLTYFRAYETPNLLFYDESYYVANATKYINNIMQFEVHPPVGKLFIALGEVLLNPNPNQSKEMLLMSETGKITEKLPEGFSMKGFRLFPVIFAWLSTLVFFYILRILSPPSVKSWLPLLFTTMYLFENSCIVFFRGALLDGILIFFSFCSIYYFLYMYKQAYTTKAYQFFYLGLLTGLAIFTKIVALIFILLPIFLLIKEIKRRLTSEQAFVKFVAYISAVFLIGFFSYYIHVFIGNKIIYNQSGIPSIRYMQLLKEGRIINPVKTLLPIHDNIQRMVITHELIKKLDDSNPNSIGSWPIGWPLGIKSIKMLKNIDEPININKNLILIGNPLNWAIGLLGILLGLGFSIFLIIKKEFNRPYILIFSSIYFGYMSAVIWGATHRILYIHLYFIPLTVSFILAYIIFIRIFRKALIFKDKRLIVSLLVVFSVIFISFRYFSPLTYFNPLTYEDCKKREWLHFWHLDCGQK